MLRNILSPSMLAIDFNNMGYNLKLAYDSGAPYIHVDVMDGHFVPNISFGPPVISYVRKAVPDAVLDVHMMVEEPLRFLDDYKKAGADLISIHIEAVSDIVRDVRRLHESGLRCSVAINPDTDVTGALEMIEPVIDMVDMLLIMSVYPGFGGQRFIPETLPRIREVREWLDVRSPQTDIEVDGGITTDNVSDVLSAGANVIVAGSAVFKGSPADNIHSFLELLKQE